MERVGQQIRLKGPVPLKVGVAKVEITPAVGTPLAGYSKRRGKPSVGIRDPLYVRALVLNDGEDILVLVSADILLFPPPLAEEILDEVSEQLKIPKRAIVLAGTHTHSGLGSIADGFLYQMVFGSYQSQIVEGLKGRVIWAVRQAFDHQQPARWGVGKGNLLLRGLIENRMDPLGGVDPAVTVLLFDSMEGRPLAILANASAHPTLMDSKAFRFSADYPGEFCRLIEETYPGATCLFVNGAAGDLRPKGEIGSSPEERIGRFGRALAEGVTGLVNQISVKSNGDLAAWGWEIPLPPPQLHLGPIPIPSQIGRFIRPTSSDLNLLALDQVLFVPLSGEMTTGLGQDLRQKLEAQGLSPILVEYANGYLGYAVTPEQWSRRSYEAWMTWYGPSFGLYLVDRVQELAGLYKEKRK
ncbi:MAG: neutral/alkaline non-lysosomal ceramidase N-terminal domain-containing protein [Candidatus Omnitrophica bacterium]|nr:neutral/alkaline non-lysosomal ceramidase N-terminal domain-containing protein [Candidatus Omnitrophota bacterium]